MSLRTAFIGVDKHADPLIGDLTGARKDATAMWALFKDSISDLDDRRLVDEEASLAGIRSALDDTLGAATSDDTVLFFFAGHGTPAHQLVPFDAQKSEPGATMLPMSELVQRLKDTKARASIVILDCCFSGGAPARVLDDIPLPRGSSLTLEDLAGKGRVIIAASKDDEPAWEANGHGLLTGSILDVLQESEQGTDIGALMDEVSKLVRTEAARIGTSQTPVVFSLIEGGITLPALRRGAHYAAAFPDTSQITVGSDIHELSAFGLPEAVVHAWATQFPGGLNELQLSAINEFRVLDGDSLLVVAPTSSGKTFVGELAAAKAIADGRKAVFLLPFKALANEKYEDFQALYGEGLGLRVIRCTGDFGDDVSLFVRGKYDIALLTYEMFLSLSLTASALLNKIGLVVLDEAQFITDRTRGINVELLLTNLLAARERGVRPQILALSAVIGSINSFDDWLGCKTLLTRNRPIPLVEGVLDRGGLFQYRTPEGEERREQLLPPYAIVQRKKAPGSQDVIVPLVQSLVREGERVVIFRSQRGSASGCAKYLADALGLPPARDVLDRLPQHDLSSTSQSLAYALNGGTAFHTSDLTRDERVLVERSFRDLNGTVHALAATSTVAAGVNTPASTVIIVETTYWGDPPQDYSVAEYKNMAGRAGRLGLTAQGRSVLLADTPIDRDRLFRRYVMGEPEPIRSSFSSREIGTWVLKLLSQVPEIARDQVSTLLANTYGGYLANRSSPHWAEQMKESLEDLMDRLIAMELLEENEGMVQLTLLGRACGRSSLSLQSATQLIAILRAAPATSITAEQLMGYVQALPEADDDYTPLYKGSRKEGEWQIEVTHAYGADVTRSLQRSVREIHVYQARCKRAAILWNWISGMPMDHIEQHYSISPFRGRIGAGDVRGFADLTRYILRSAYEIADIVLLGQGPSADGMDTLLRRIEYGLPEEALGLLDLGVRLSRGEYLALHRNGYTSPEQVMAESISKLEGFVGNSNISQLFPSA